MSNPRGALSTLVILGVCLPLAAYLGYLLATPLDLGTMTAVGTILLLLSLPLLLRWHHPMLFLSWNLSAVVFFLPGQPQIWLLMAVVSLTIALVQRTLNRNFKFITVWSLILPLLFLAAVIVVTGWCTGGIGLRVASSGTYGGKRYFLLLGAVLGFFAFCSRKIPPAKANLYIGLFFLPGLAALISSLFPLVNSSLYFIYLIFPADPYMMQAYTNQISTSVMDDLVRLSGLAAFGQAIFYYLLARHGIRTLTRPRNWWRFGLLLAGMVAGLFGGFRSSAILVGLTFCLLFWLEGLARTRLLFVFAGIGILVMVTTLPFTRQMPLPVQRALSFLPVEVDPVAAADAQTSTEWRLRIWRIVGPEVPHYLFLGKGYGINAQELELLQSGVQRGTIDYSELAILSGEYHSGPLSTIIPLGIWGVMGFLWLLAAGFHMLKKNWQFSAPELKKINTFILALFIAKVIFFMFIFGAFYSDLMAFTGLLGLSVSLNGGMCRPPVAPQKKVAIRESKLLHPTLG